MPLDVVNSSYSKNVLDSENKKLLPTRSSVLNYRRQRTELISPNTASSPSTDHFQVIIKVIFKVITKGPFIVYSLELDGVGGIAVDFCCYTVRVRVINFGDSHTT